MKVAFYSDLHIEISPFTFPPEIWEEIDLLVLAGDIGTGKKALAWIKKSVPKDIPVYWVWGNHEYYSGHFATTRLKSVRELGKDSNIQILENRTVEFNGIRFLGCTLWTDCKVHEEKLGGFTVTQEIASRMNDYLRIRTGGSYRKLRVGETIVEHQSSVRWLKSELEKKHSGKTVVITHHGPHPKCLNDIGDPVLDGAYASDLSDLIDDYQPNIWIYGHTHLKADFKVGQTRLLSNPRGYESYGEKTGFDPYWVVEV